MNNSEYKIYAKYLFFSYLHKNASQKRNIVPCDNFGVSGNKIRVDGQSSEIRVLKYPCGTITRAKRLVSITV